MKHPKLFESTKNNPRNWRLFLLEWTLSVDDLHQKTGQVYGFYEKTQTKSHHILHAFFSIMSSQSFSSFSSALNPRQKQFVDTIYSEYSW